VDRRFEKINFSKRSSTVENLFSTRPQGFGADVGTLHLMIAGILARNEFKTIEICEVVKVPEKPSGLKPNRR
jgi:hypothetical protein